MKSLFSSRDGSLSLREEKEAAVIARDDSASNLPQVKIASTSITYTWTIVSGPTREKGFQSESSTRKYSTRKDCALIKGSAGEKTRIATGCGLHGRFCEGSAALHLPRGLPRACVINEPLSRCLTYPSTVPTNRNSDKVQQLKLLQQTVGEVLSRVRVPRHALVLSIQEDFGPGEGERHGPHGVVCLPREFRVRDASISQLRDEFRARLQNERRGDGEADGPPAGWRLVKRSRESRCIIKKKKKGKKKIEAENAVTFESTGERNVNLICRSHQRCTCSVHSTKKERYDDACARVYACGEKGTFISR